MAIAANLGFPRLGARRQLKRAVEEYWAGNLDPEELQATAAGLRREHWRLQQSLGIEHVPSGDFSLFDHVLDTAAMLGAVPKRFAWSGAAVDPATYFAMARGTNEVPPLDMTKWFDTNYHYLVPEFEPGMKFKLASTKPVDHFLEAAALGIHTRPVLLGPLTFLLLGRCKAAKPKPLGQLDKLLPIYEEVLWRLAHAGADWVQIDEPALALDLSEEALRRVGVGLCAAECGVGPDPDLPDDLLRRPGREPAGGVAAARGRGPSRPGSGAGAIGPGFGSRAAKHGALAGRDRRPQRVAGRSGAGVGAVGTGGGAARSRPDHGGPLLLALALPDGPRQRAVAGPRVERLDGLRQAEAAGGGDSRAGGEPGPGRGGRRTGGQSGGRRGPRRSTRIHNRAVSERVAKIDEDMLRRRQPFARRREAQRRRLGLPLLPTTTIGSFPQTAEVRKARAAMKKGQWSAQRYEAFCKEEIKRTVRFQEEIDLDVLVHGEFERADLVEYFGEQLEGFAFTANGWVQSLGPLCVKPPVIFGDVSRPRPMTSAGAGTPNRSLRGR